MSFYKNGLIETPYTEITNLYSGKQYNASWIGTTYDYPTDIFKDYGFNTCFKMTPTQTDTTKQFLAYSYLINTNQTDVSAEYVVSLYAYVSTDCNADFRLHLEHSNTWISAYGNYDSQIIHDKTKGKVIWVWGRIKPNPNDGKVYIMFYPNPNQIGVFTQGYQLVTGITLYKGTEVSRPMNNQTSGSGIIQNTSALLTMNKNYILGNNYIEF